MLAEEFAKTGAELCAALNALWLDLANAGHYAASAEALLVLADAHAAEKRSSEAAIAARIAARYAHQAGLPSLAAAAYLREARWWLEDGIVRQAAHKLRRLDLCRPGIALDFDAQVAETRGSPT